MSDASFCCYSCDYRELLSSLSSSICAWSWFISEIYYAFMLAAISFWLSDSAVFFSIT